MSCSPVRLMVNCCDCVESMVDVQSTPDSAVSPTYSALHTFQTDRYDVDVPSITLDPFCYAVCPSASDLIPGQAQTSAARLDMHAGGYPAGPARLHHGCNKRLKYPAADDVAAISFATTRTDGHRQLSGQQSTQAWNSVAATHGIKTATTLLSEPHHPG